MSPRDPLAPALVAGLLVVSVLLGTAAMELAAGLVVATALSRAPRHTLRAAVPLLALVAAGALDGTPLVRVGQRVWTWAPLAALPVLWRGLNPTHQRRVQTLAVMSVAAAGAWAAVEALSHGRLGAAGPMSTAATLGHAVVPALVALPRSAVGGLAALGIGVGVVASGDPGVWLTAVALVLTRLHPLAGLSSLVAAPWVLDADPGAWPLLGDGGAQLVANTLLVVTVTLKAPRHRAAMVPVACLVGGLSHPVTADLEVVRAWLVFALMVPSPRPAPESQAGAR